MEEFLYQHRWVITRVVELTAALTGIILFKKFRFTYARYFIYFLIYLSLGDFINTYSHYTESDEIFGFLKGTVLEENYWWSTLFWKVGAIMFFSFYYYKILITKQLKAIIKYIGIIFFIFSVIYILFHWDEYFISFFPAISVFGACIIFICTVFYFIEVLQSDKILTFLRSLNFYISAAIFIWWLIITPIVFYDIYGENRDLTYIQLKKYIYLLANIVMYSTFTFALIFCKPENDKILLKDINE